MAVRGTTRKEPMELSRAISLMAIVLIIVVAAGYAASDDASAEETQRAVATAK
jgi:hypothetical protein